jgi:hypothetical protein
LREKRSLVKGQAQRGTGGDVTMSNSEGTQDSQPDSDAVVEVGADDLEVSDAEAKGIGGGDVQKVVMEYKTSNVTYVPQKH